LEILKHNFITTLTSALFMVASFPGLHPDFISQQWRKIGRRPGAIYHVTLCIFNDRAKRHAHARQGVVAPNQCTGAGLCTLVL